MNIIDEAIQKVILDELGSDEGKAIIESMENVMLEQAAKVPSIPTRLEKPRTRGDWTISLPFEPSDVRPITMLNYNIIDEMLKSGVIRFALDMKRAQMVSIFRNKRSTKVHCINKDLAEVTEASLEQLLPHMAYEFSKDALINGSAFMELGWTTKTKYELGLSDIKGGPLYSVPRRAYLVPHKTIRKIRRKPDGSFNGFTQIDPQAYLTTTSQYTNAEGDIIVPPEAALVIPYNGYSRNLWGESMLKPIYPLWFHYELVLTAMVQFAQMMGDPPRIAKAPSRRKVRIGSTSTSLIDAVDYMLALSANLPKTNSAVIPSDRDESGNSEYELSYLQLPDRSQPFVQIIELFNKLILRAALAGDTSLIQPMGDTGSRAIGEVHAEATALHNEMIVNEWLYYINEFLMPQIAYYNLGQNPPPLYLEVAGLDPRERDFLESVMNIAGNSSSFQEFFYRVDWDNLGRLSGLPMLTDAQAAELKKKLHEESISNQEDQLNMQKKFSDGQGNEKTKDNSNPIAEQKKIEKLIDAGMMYVSEDDIEPDYEQMALAAIAFEEAFNGTLY